MAHIIILHLQIYFATARIGKGMLDNTKGGQYDAGAWVGGQPSGVLFQALDWELPWPARMCVLFSSVGFTTSTSWN